MTKRASPQALQPFSESTHCPKVSRYSVVLIEAPRNAPQPGSDLIQGLMHPAAQRLLNLLQLGHHPLVCRLTPDHEQAPRTGPTLVGKSEERERLRLLFSSLAPVYGREPAELQQARLFWMKFQIKLRQPDLKISQEPLGIGFALKSHYQIVRVTDHYYLPIGYFPPPCFYPKVENVVQIHIGQQRPK